MKVGILGAGGMGNVHARHLSCMPGVQLVFHELDPKKGELFGTKYDARHLASNDLVIESADIVDICLPSDLHTEVALKAIAARKPTFIEKPLACGVVEGANIVNAAARAGVPLGAGQVVRFFPEFETARRMVREGKIGNPAAARTRRGGGPPGKGGASWFMDHRRSGGVLIDLAVHDFDWLRWTLGEVKFLYARSLGAQTMSGPDYALTTLTFDGGAVAHVESTWMDPSGFRTAFEVCGSGGMIEFDSRNTPTMRTSTPEKTVNEAPLAARDDPFYRELKAFIDSVESKTEPPVSGLDGLMALSIAEAALDSARTGKVVAPAREF